MKLTCRAEVAAHLHRSLEIFLESGRAGDSEKHCRQTCIRLQNVLERAGLRRQEENWYGQPRRFDKPVTFEITQDEARPVHILLQKLSRHPEIPEFAAMIGICQEIGCKLEALNSIPARR